MPERKWQNVLNMVDSYSSDNRTSQSSLAHVSDGSHGRFLGADYNRRVSKTPMEAIWLKRQLGSCSNRVNPQC